MNFRYILWIVIVLFLTLADVHDVFATDVKPELPEPVTIRVLPVTCYT